MVRCVRSPAPAQAMHARPSILNNRRSYEDYLDNQVSVGPGQEHECHATLL